MRTTTPNRATVRRVAPRVVPVATALKSLIPPSASSSQPLRPVRAEQIHHPVFKTGPTPLVKRLAVAPPELRALRSSTWWPAVGVLTAALVVSALAILTRPLAPPSAGTSSGQILGLETTEPLRVTVEVNQPAGQSTVSTTVPTGTMAEAISRTATALGGRFTYSSRGSSIYLVSFMGRSNDQSGHWEVRLNGQQVSDLSLTPLSQGDTLTLSWL